MHDTPASRKKALRSSIQLFFMSVLAFVIGFLMSYDAAKMQDDTWGIDDVDGSIIAQDAAIDLAASEEDVPSTTLELLGRIALKQRQLNSEITREYGMFGKDIFNTINVENIIQLSPLSKTKLLRKIMIKIVLGRIKQQSDDGAHGKPTFHWVTVGDSSAAGYGNTYSQSYTSMLETTVSSIFQSAGIEFVASNRAGDAFSGMEIAFCMKEIFGAEVDALSWDFTPLDDNYFDPLSNTQGLDPLLFAERVGMTYYPQMPFIYVLGRAAGVELQQQLGGLENRGFGYGMMMDASLREVALSIPNRDEKEKGGNQPAVVSKFHCNGAIEGVETCDNIEQMHQCYSNQGGECIKAKHDVPKECVNPRYQTPWNDGFKMHRLKGLLLSYHLIEMLRLAALELDLLEMKQPHLRDNPLETLDLLNNVEEVEGFLFLKTTAAASSTEESSWEWLKVKKSDCLNAMSMVQQNDPIVGFPPTELHPSQALCKDFVPVQTAFFRIDDREQRIRLDPVLQPSEGVREVMYGLCLHASRCEADQCDTDHTLSPDNLVTVDTIQASIHGESVSEVIHMGGCYFLANKEGLKWKQDIGISKLAAEITMRTSKPFYVSSFFVLQ